MLDVMREEIQKALRRHWAGLSLLARVLEPQQEWRVKVRFLTVPLPDVTARVAQPAWAVGAQAIAPLKRGDEVLVVFPDGDLNGLPIVTHRLFNGIDKPPTANPDEFVIDLTDAGGSLQVKLKKTASGSVQLLVETGDVEITCTQGNASVLCPQGSVTVTCKNATVTATEQAVVDSPSILLGDGATEPVPLGNQLKSWLDSHVHQVIGSDSMGHSINFASQPPSSPLPDATLSDVSKTKKS